MTNQAILTINARGQILGDTSHIPAETLEKLQSPEATAQMRRMYRQSHDTGRRATSRTTARMPKPEQRDFRHLCPPGMSAKEFSKLRRKYIRQQTKAVIKEQRSQRNGN